MAQLKVLAHGRATQVQIAILHAQVVTTVGIVFHLERWCKALAEDVQFAHQDFDVARRHLGILALALAYLTFHLNTVFAPQFVGTLTELGILCLVENQLC